MAVEILLLQVGPSNEEGRLVRCLAGDGEKVIEGQPLFAVEYRGDLHDIEAPGTGTLKISAAVGTTYEVGTVLGYIE